MAVSSISGHVIASEGNYPIRDMSPTLLEKARQALANYFKSSTADGDDMSDDIILSILLARNASVEQNDQRFEQFILAVGKYCDERCNEASNAWKTVRRNFLRLVGILQRLDEASKSINKLVFFARGIPDIVTLDMLSATWNELNAIKPGLNRKLLIDDLLTSDLPGRMGHKRLTHLLEGLECLSQGVGTVLDIHQRLGRVEREEQTLVKVVSTIQDAIGNRYGWLAGDCERDTIKRIVSIELRHQRFLDGDIPDNLFDVGLRLAKNSLMYMNTLLPIIVSQSDVGLREEFIRDSGLDRLLVEELEEFWCSRENISHNRLAPIRNKS